jgi:single-stranded DNA-binding protein
MIDALIAGKLYGAPQRRSSKTGTQFVTGKLRASMGDESVFINFICFRETVGLALLALTDGTPCAIAGDMKITTYTARDGTTRPSIDITVSEILTPHHVSRRRQAMKDTGATKVDGNGERDRELPFGHQPAKPAASTAAEQEEDFNDPTSF